MLRYGQISDRIVPPIDQYLACLVQPRSRYLWDARESSDLEEERSAKLKVCSRSIRSAFTSGGELYSPPVFQFQFQCSRCLEGIVAFCSSPSKRRVHPLKLASGSEMINRHPLVHQVYRRLTFSGVSTPLL